MAQFDHSLQLRRNGDAHGRQTCQKGEVIFLDILPDNHDAENSCFSGPVARMAPCGEKILFFFGRRISQGAIALAIGGFGRPARRVMGNG
ncbi:MULTISPECIES: hypothetical protein [Agrobacterium]|uniref:hypothetical protein n=1 Tax=Agrobacterium TaxID=357 RepID=UPI00174CADFA|nr:MULTISPECIES: hypothetical protein [Agrobacterium]MCZ7854767.1 hypothetical protein [Agrobacterium salinitolerans]MDA5638840.1 hypothetical protein [Agrobacterium sp. ST15.13.013]MDA6980710.1 hypothetical protein [Agrobacterium salinitolerans]MDA6998476.1 hypothetical protein [Agrobacterium salinitolerans]